MAIKTVLGGVRVKRLLRVEILLHKAVAISHTRARTRLFYNSYLSASRFHFCFMIACSNKFQKYIFKIRISFKLHQFNFYSVCQKNAMIWFHYRWHLLLSHVSSYAIGHIWLHTCTDYSFYNCISLKRVQWVSTVLNNIKFNVLLYSLAFIFSCRQMLLNCFHFLNFF